jgi:hypothetical protein
VVTVMVRCLDLDGVEGSGGHITGPVAGSTVRLRTYHVQRKILLT